MQLSFGFEGISHFLHLHVISRRSFQTKRPKRISDNCNQRNIHTCLTRNHPWKLANFHFLVRWDCPHGGMLREIGCDAVEQKCTACQTSTPFIRVHVFYYFCIISDNYCLAHLSQCHCSEYLPTLSQVSTHPWVHVRNSFLAYPVSRPIHICVFLFHVHRLRPVAPHCHY